MGFKTYTIAGIILASGVAIAEDWYVQAIVDRSQISHC